MSNNMRYYTPIILLVLVFISCEELERINPYDPMFTLEAPSDLEFQVLTDSEIQLSWHDNSDHEEGFHLERNQGNGFVRVAEIDADLTIYVDTDLVVETSYIYRISGFVGSNQSDWVTWSVASTTFPSPSGLTATAISDIEIDLSWTDNCDIEGGFKVERDDGSGFNLITELEANAIEFSDNSVDYGKDYIYRVAGFTTGNLSNWASSDTISTTILSPDSLTLTIINDMEIRVNWGDNCSYEQGFRIERNDGSGFEQIAQLGANVLEYLDTDLDYDISYTYKVLAFTSENESDYSNTETISISSLETMWSGTWKVTGTTNQYNDMQLNVDETLTFTNATYGGSDVSGNVTMVSIYHGIVFGSFTYNPTGQTLIISYTENPYEESFNGVVMGGETLSFLNSDYSFNMTKQVDVSTYDAAIWNGTWIVTNTTNQYNDMQLSMNETLTFSDAEFNGVEVSGITTMVSIYHGSVSGPFTYNPTGQTLIINYTTQPYDESFNGIAIEGSILSFSNNDYDFTLTLQTENTNIVTDIDGNVYQTVNIGDQVWMAENLKVTHYRDGTAITNVTDSGTWGNLTTEAYCIYNNNASNENETYGALYNWYAVTDSRNIAPEGWHVPSEAEWQVLIDYLGGDAVASGKMKATGTIEDGNGFWFSPNAGATNESGFTAIPGGNSGNNGDVGYNIMGYLGYFWSSTAYNSSRAIGCYLYYDHSGVTYNSGLNSNGFSVRCVRD
jgi:uncharacterized protein (TIGR02145 family)